MHLGLACWKRTMETSRQIAPKIVQSRTFGCRPFRSPQLEPVPVLPERDAEAAQEDAARRGGRAQAALLGDLIERQRGLLQEPSRCVEANLLDVDGGAQAGLAPKYTGEVARAHRGASGEGRQAHVLIRMVED